MTPRFQVVSRNESVQLLELHDTAARSQVVLAPARGGMVTRFSVADRELFFLNEETFFDTQQNVRGGNPVLFPSPGKLAGDTWSWHGQARPLTQHGFARLLPWSEQHRQSDQNAQVTLRLTATAETLARYPFHFVVDLTYCLVGTHLQITQRVGNEGTEAMPFGFGFHPYFWVPQRDKSRVRIASAATRVFDNVTKSNVPFAPPNLCAQEVDWHLLDHGSTTATLELADGARLEIVGSPEYTHWVIWTKQGHDFVCLEPWTSPGGALASHDRLLVVEPGGERTLQIAIRYQPG